MLSRHASTRWLGVVAAAVLAAGVVHPAASAAPAVAGGVERDNVDRAHSPRMEAELAKGTARQAIGTRSRGVDVASHQHPDGAAIDWTRVAKAGHRFAGVKATEGDYYANPFHAGDRKGARAAGMYTFPYHFAVPNVSGGAAQARYFLDRAGYAADGRTLSPVLDIEWNPYVDDDHTNSCYGLSRAGIVGWVRAFVNEVKRRTGVPATIYTAASWWRSCAGGSAAFARNPLWVASIADTPALPTGWRDWTLWQYGQTAVPGIRGQADVNFVKGGEPALAALAADATRAAEARRDGVRP